MRLRYHLDKPEGIIVLESSPQVRSLFVRSQVKSIIRVPLPYIYFTIRYNNKNVITYPGVYGCGLFVSCSLKPIESFDDQVNYLPTDSGLFKGLVCTNHSYDNKVFKTVEELTNFVVTLWWSASHEIFYHPFLNVNTWCDKKLNEISIGNWQVQSNFRESITKIPKINLQFTEIAKLPYNAVLINEEYPVKSKLILC